MCTISPVAILACRHASTVRLKISRNWSAPHRWRVRVRRALRLTKAAELAEAAIEETLTYYAFPEEHWRRIRTNNPLERLLREIRRRTRVVGAFPDGELALNLAAARLRHIDGTAWSTKQQRHLGTRCRLRGRPPHHFPVWNRPLPSRVRQNQSRAANNHRKRCFDPILRRAA